MYIESTARAVAMMRSSVVVGAGCRTPGPDVHV
jgi:hypothetical protein